MQYATRFAVAIHILLLVETFKERKVTGDFIASSVNTNPAVIRRIVGYLKSAGLIETRAGTGGIRLAREPGAITLLDVFRSTHSGGGLFKIHEDTAPGCPVGGNISELLEGFFSRVKIAMKRELDSMTLGDLMAELSRLRTGKGKGRGARGRD